MRNLKLEIEYDGTNYCGWQVQNSRKPQGASCKQKTIQGTIEKVLCKILQEDIRLIGSGRTDAGVHALAQIANFKTHSVVSTKKLFVALNGLLPDDITVKSVKEAAADFHSRFDALSKHYRYAILNRASPSALLRHQAYFFSYPLDVKLMRKEARMLIGRHDFSVFQRTSAKKRDPVRVVRRCSVTKCKEYIYIDIEANGFLYTMARSIVGTLIEIGKGRFPQGTIKKLLLRRMRSLAGPTAPAHGLCLMKVNYCAKRYQGV